MPPETGPAAPAPQQPVRISADAVQAARVMVDTFRLPSLRKPEDILEGILDGLAALVHPDAAGVYVVDARGQTLRYTLVRGCDYPVARLEAPFEEQGAIGRVLATGRPLQVTADSAPDARAHLRHEAGRVHAGHVRQLRLVLVETLRLQRVGILHARERGAHQDVPGLADGRRHVLQRQHVPERSGPGRGPTVGVEAGETAATDGLDESRHGDCYRSTTTVTSCAALSPPSCARHRRT